MKKLIWKLRYAWHMRKRTGGADWSFCWETAQLAIDNDPDWYEWKPEDSCDEELSCWDAD